MTHRSHGCHAKDGPAHQERQVVEIVCGFLQEEPLGHLVVAVPVLCMYLCYGLVLIAYSFADDPSYAVGFRQLSIPLSAVGGVFLLGEQGSVPKLFGVILIFCGALLVAVG